ncbi:MAG: hypothetical protein JWR63_4554 [Conexibacter sp.]|nr:hypothetical protein [Conexibacter sp.]
MSAQTQHFPFVQFEFTHELGPTPGRYVARRPGAAPDAEHDLLIFGVAAGTISDGRRRRRGTRRAGAPGADPVPLAIVTHVRTELGGDEQAASSWMHACRDDAELCEEWVGTALELTNVAVRAHRATCADPYCTEVTVADPRVVRLGYGPAAAVTDGEWTAAFAVPPIRRPRVSHAERSGPSEAVAGALGGRVRATDADELLLRALLDLDQGRAACAAIQLAGAVRMLRLTLDSAGLDEAALRARVERLPAAAGRLDAVVTGLPEADVGVLHKEARAIRELLDSWREHELARARPT